MKDEKVLSEEEDLLMEPVNKRLWSEIRIEELEDRAELTPPVPPVGPNWPLRVCGACETPPPCGFPPSCT